VTLGYDPFDLRLRADPYPHYARLRAEAPVYWAESSRTWVVSRHDDVLEVLKQPERFSSDAVTTVLARASGRAETPSGPPMPGNLVTYDPPGHTRLRAIVNRAFTPRRVESWRPMIEDLADSLVSKMARRGRFDVIGDLAVWLPVTVIAEILGVDASRRADFKRWADTIAAWMTGSKRTMDPVESGMMQASLELAQHLGAIIEARLAEPTDDMVSVLTRAQEGEVLSPQEVLGFAGVLLFAGTETTTNLIGNAVRVLVEQARVRDRVLRAPELIPPLLEETLRWDSPVQYLFRRSTESVEIAGRRIPEDGIVTVLLGSANRDPSRWGDDAELFDIDRRPTGQLGFGVGAHYCLGAALARMEAECALDRLLPLLGKSNFVGHAMEPIDSVQFRGVARLEFEAS
jgi:cytochrome P450